MALTAAECYEKRCNSPCILRLHKNNLLSFPPEASSYSSKDHRRPQISCLCPKYFCKDCSGVLTSLTNILRSLDPLASKYPFQVSDPIRPVCPSKVLSSFYLATSYIYTSPYEFPTAIWLPL